jgi:hypothetical protein
LAIRIKAELYITGLLFSLIRVNIVGLRNPEGDSEWMTSSAGFVPFKNPRQRQNSTAKTVDE